MSREEARQNLVALGIEEPTEVQVTNYLNQFHANRNPQPQPNDEMEKLRQQVAKLQSENAKKDILAYATSKGLSGEQVANVLAAYGDNLDAAKSSIDAICTIISEREAAAATAKEQEIANKATNPGGGAGGGSGKEKTSAEQIAEKLFAAKKSENNILSHYVGGN